MQSIVQVSGKKGALLSMLMGGLAALSLAPLYLVFLLIPSFGFWFYRLLTAESRKQALWLSWCWGFGFFVVGLTWMANPLWMFKELYGWLIPFELIGLNGGLAIFPMLCGGVFYALKGYVLGGKSLVRSAFVFTTLYVASEWLRGNILTGFPWNLAGYGFGVSDITIQMAAVMNIYALTAVAVLLALSPTVIVVSQASRLWFALPVLALVAMTLFGFMRVQDANPYDTDIKIRIVQANIPQELKWDPSYMEQALQKHVELTQSAGLEKANVIIWPETAFPFMLKEDSKWPKMLGGLLTSGQLLVTGVIRSTGTEKNWKIYNSLIVIDHEGNIIGQYDKHHLVPFGEYVPLRHILPLEKITAGATDFSAGDQPTAIKLANSSAMLPLICYEVIFPRYAAADESASWMVNVTNDGWFGHSAEPYQHLDMSRFRAVEQGKPMVRAANTGISAVIDAYGRVKGRIPYHIEGVLDINLPQAINK